MSSRVTVAAKSPLVSLLAPPWGLGGGLVQSTLPWANMEFECLGINTPRRYGVFVRNYGDSPGLQ